MLRATLHGLRHILYFSVIFTFVYSALRLAGPLFMILTFDRVLPSRSAPTLVALLILLVIVLLVMTLLDYSRRRILARFGAQFQERIEDHIFSSTSRDTYFRRTQAKPAPGLNQADELRGFFHSSSLMSVLDILWCPLFVAVVFFVSPAIGWVLVAGFGVLVLIMIAKALFTRGRDEHFSEASHRISDLKDQLQASRDVIETQQMMAAHNERWVQARRQARDRAIELNDWTAWFSSLSYHAATLVQYVALAAGAYLAISGQLTIGGMIACMYLSRQVLHPFQRFLQKIPSILQARANWVALDKILKESGQTGDVVEGAMTLSLSQVTVRSPVARRKLLRNIHFKVSPGSAIEIVGNSGSGKTVLAEALIGRCPRRIPFGASDVAEQTGCRRTGDVLLGAVDVERLSIVDAANIFGYVPQLVGFVSGTIEENIAGLRAEPDRKRLEHVARLAQLHERILALPEGYRTPIDTAGSIFSKSERHQLALARALYPNPKVLIVDEPDQTFREGLSKGLKSEIAAFLNAGGILVIFSRLALRSFRPTRRFALENGELTEVKFDRNVERKVVRIKDDGESPDLPGEASPPVAVSRGEKEALPRATLRALPDLQLGEASPSSELRDPSSRLGMRQPWEKMRE